MRHLSKTIQSSGQDAFDMFALANISAVLFDRDLNLLRNNIHFAEKFSFADGEIREASIDNLATPQVKKEGEQLSVSIAVRPYFETLSEHTTHLSVDAAFRDHRIHRLTFTCGPKNTLLLTLREIAQSDESGKNLDQLDWSLQLASKELAEFSHAINHDLRSPVRAMRTIPEWIQADLEAMLGQVPSEIQSHIDMLHKQANRLEAMLEDLLTYTQLRHSGIELQPVSLRTVLLQLQRELDLPMGFTIEFPDQNKQLYVPEEELRLALRKLIENAFRHHHLQDAGHVAIEISDSASAVTLRVIDDGPGIPKQHHQTALTVFSTLHSRDQQEGSGMGLSIAQKIVTNWGGKLSIHPGLEQRGTCVALSIPADRCAA